MNLHNFFFIFFDALINSTLIYLGIDFLMQKKTTRKFTLSLLFVMMLFYYMYKFFSIVSQNEQFLTLLYFELIIYLFLFISKSKELIFAYIVSRIQYLTILMLSIPFMLGLNRLIPFHPFYMLTDNMHPKYFFATFFIRTLQFLLCLAFRPLLKKAFHLFSTISYRYLLLIFIFLNLILPFFNVSNSNNPYTAQYLALHFSHLTVLLSIIYLLIFLFYNLSCIRQSHTESKKRTQLLQFQEEYLTSISRIMKQTAKFRHDLSNQIQVLERNLDILSYEDSISREYYTRLQNDWSIIQDEFNTFSKLTPNNVPEHAKAIHFINRIKDNLKEEATNVFTISTLLVVILFLHFHDDQMEISLTLLFLTLILLILINVVQIKSINNNLLKSQSKNETYTSIQKDMYLIETLFSNIQSQLSILQKHDEKNLMTKMLHQYDQTFLRFQTSSSILNTLLLIKDQQCKKKSIEFRCSLSLTNQYLVIEYELCKLLMNLLDNAIDACHHSKLTSPTIQLTLFQKMNFLCLSIANSKNTNHKPISSGMQSTKKSSDHGLGMEIINEIVDSLHGTIEMKDHETQFFIKILLQLPT
jgi:signal transduction histidine kinase